MNKTNQNYGVSFLVDLIKIRKHYLHLLQLNPK